MALVFLRLIALVIIVEGIFTNCITPAAKEGHENMEEVKEDGRTNLGRSEKKPMKELNCGVPPVPPTVHPIAGKLEPVMPSTFTWTVNICQLADFTSKNIDCRSLIGLVLGGRWILTTIWEEIPPESLVVITGAEASLDLINPDKVNMFTVHRIVQFPPDEMLLSLLELNQEIDIYETTVRSVCLPRQQNNEKRFNNTGGLVVGWTLPPQPVNLNISSVERFVRLRWNQTTLPKAGFYQAQAQVNDNSHSTAKDDFRFMQLYTNTCYQPGYNSTEIYMFDTGVPFDKKHQFNAGSQLLRESNGHWFVFGVNWLTVLDRGIATFSRTDLFCNWILNETEGQVQCFDFE